MGQSPWPCLNGARLPPPPRVLAWLAMQSVAATSPRLAWFAGLLLAVLALAGQLAVGGLAPAGGVADQELSELAALTSQCRGMPPAGTGHESRRHRLPDCTPAASTAGLVLPGFLASPGPALPPPSAQRAPRLASAVSARGPPSHRVRVGFPRGPPVLA